MVRSALSFVLVVVASTAGWSEYKDGGFSSERVAVGIDDQGRSASTVVVVADAQAQRSAHRLELSRPIPWANDLFMLLLGVVWLVFFASLKRGEDQASPPYMGPIWLVMSGLTGLLAWVVLSSQVSVSGESGVRAVLSAYEVDGLQSFSVPSETWTYVSSLTGTALVAFGLSVLGVVVHWLPALNLSAARYGLGVGALLALIACAMQLMSVGGLPWRSTEGALWATAILLGASWLENGRPFNASFPCVLAVGICAIAMG